MKARGLVLCGMDHRPRLVRFFHVEHLTRLLFGLLAGSMLLIADGYVLILLSRVVGIYLLLAVEAATGLIAVVLILGSYRNTIDDVRSSIRSGQTVERKFRWMVCLWVGSLLLLVPGFVTDVLGIVVFVPPFSWIVGGGGVRLARKEFDELAEHLKLEQ